MKRKELTGFIGFLIIMMFAAVAWASPVPDTGQTNCYDMLGFVITCPSLGQELFGQDANFTLYPPSYTKMDSLGNALPDAATSWAMVRDNVTGLIWEVKRNHDNYTNIADLHDADNQYPWNDHPGGDPPFYYSVHEFIDALNEERFGNFSDWRLPSIQELNSIFLYSEESQNNDYIVVYKNTNYWSSTSSACMPDSAWLVNFMFCTEGAADKSLKYCAMAVRGGQSVNSATMSSDAADSGSQDGASTAAAYRDNGDGTVTDLSTDLMWEKIGVINKMDWSWALFHARIPATGGYRDWRLPTIKELQSLMDYSRCDPAINPIFPVPEFPAPDDFFAYWSSTSNFMRPWDAFIVNYVGKSDYISKGTEFHVRLVRGGPLLAFLSVSPATQNVTSLKGSTTFIVSNDGTGPMPWSVKHLQDSYYWLDISTAVGSNVIKCNYSENTGLSARTATIRVTADGAIGSPVDITVTQAGLMTTGSLAASFAGFGLWVYNSDSAAWMQVSPANPENMFYSGSTLYGDFGGLGLWKWDGASWAQLSPANPESMVASGSTLYGDFGGLGLWMGNGASWAQLSPANPESMVASGSTLYGEFGGSGLWKWDGSAWTQLTTANPENVVASGSTLYAYSGTLGLWRWDGMELTQLTPLSPENMEVSGSTLYGDFGGSGLWRWDGSAWTQLTTVNPENMVTSGSTLFADFGTSGIWMWTGAAWAQLSPANPESMVASGSTLFADFGGLGLWKWNGASWAQLTGSNPDKMEVSN